MVHHTFNLFVRRNKCPQVCIYLMVYHKNAQVMVVWLALQLASRVCWTHLPTCHTIGMNVIWCTIHHLFLVYSIHLVHMLISKKNWQLLTGISRVRSLIHLWSSEWGKTKRNACSWHPYNTVLKWRNAHILQILARKTWRMLLRV